MTQKMTAHDYVVRDELEDLADELDAVTAERDALRKQIAAIKAAWNKSTGWREVGEEAERILREGSK